MSAALAASKSTLAGLEHMKLKIDALENQPQDSIVLQLSKDVLALTLQTKFEKARLTSFELISHLESKSRVPKWIKKEETDKHYAQIMKQINGVMELISNIQTTSSLVSLDKDLGAIEVAIMPLTQQTPYTLLMMRVVEIGLPIVLCLLSFFFVLRYSLTDKRSQKIKELLMQRSLESLNGKNGATEATIV